MDSMEDRLQPMTLIGDVETGVEHGSVVLREADGAQWQIGQRWSHLVGCSVQVVGRPRPEVMSLAQQGTLFAVDDVRVLHGTPRDPTQGPGRHEI